MPLYNISLLAAPEWLKQCNHPQSGKTRGPGAMFQYKNRLSRYRNIFRVTGYWCGEFTGPRWIPLMQSFDVFFDLRPKQLSKQWWGWWLGRQSCPLWRHSNGFELAMTSWSTLAHVMDCCLFGPKPSPKPILTYWQMDHWRQTSMNLESKCNNFHLRKHILSTTKSGHFTTSLSVNAVRSWLYSHGFNLTTYRRSCCPLLSTESRGPRGPRLSNRSSRSLWSGRSCRPSWPWKSWSSGDPRCTVRPWRSLLSWGPIADVHGTTGWDTGRTSRAFRSCWTGCSCWTFNINVIDYHVKVNTKWPPFYRLYFQINFLEMNLFHFDEYFPNISLQGYH